jgi:hypothetical protein
MEHDPEDLTLLVRSEYIQDSEAKSTDVQYLELRLNDHIAENEERFAALEGVNDSRKVIYKGSKAVFEIFKGKSKERSLKLPSDTFSLLGFFLFSF